MHKLIRNYNNNNKAIIDAGDEIISMIYFNLIGLSKGEKYSLSINNYETVWAVLQGNVNINVDKNLYTNVGKRESIWTGKADSVYAGSGSDVIVISHTNNTQIAVAGGYCERKFDSFRITPDEVEMVEVGSSETKSHRKIFHILGHNGNGRTGNLLVSELYCEEGCWSGYPPHKHDMENLPEETAFEELYHYRFKPENGFGGQFIYNFQNEPEVFMTRSGDTFVFSSGYHPTVTSPGHEEYIFTVLVGKHQRSLIQNFKEEYQYLMNIIPGITGMREKFK